MYSLTTEEVSLEVGICRRSFTVVRDLTEYDACKSDWKVVEGRRGLSILCEVSCHLDSQHQGHIISQSYTFRSGGERGTSKIRKVLS